MKTCGGDDFTVKDDEELRANYTTIILRSRIAISGDLMLDPQLMLYSYRTREFSLRILLPNL
jgi:hypothetical protein